MVVFTAFVGIQLIASAFEGYLLGFGKMGDGLAGAASRILLFAAGMSLALPGGGDLGISHLQLLMAAAVFAGTALFLSKMARGNVRLAH
jgi:hypothetical protein